MQLTLKFLITNANKQNRNFIIPVENPNHAHPISCDDLGTFRSTIQNDVGHNRKVMIHSKIPKYLTHMLSFDYYNSDILYMIQKTNIQI